MSVHEHNTFISGLRFFSSFYETYLFDPHILGIVSLFILLFINNDVATRNIYMYVTIYNISLCDTFGENVYDLFFL